MIVEERTYQIVAGQLPTYLEIYEGKGLEIQKGILGNLVGYFVCEIGTPGCLVHLWSYSSLEDRFQRRAMLAADPGWQDYLKLCTPLIQKMENRILLPTSFSPIR